MNSHGDVQIAEPSERRKAEPARYRVVTSYLPHNADTTKLHNADVTAPKIAPAADATAITKPLRHADPRTTTVYSSRNWA